MLYWSVWKVHVHRSGAVAACVPLWYLCLAASPYAFPSLLAFTDPSHITFGSDFPFAPDAVGAYFAGELDMHFANDSLSLGQINSGTAAELFPRFSKQCNAAGAEGRDEL